MEDPMLARTLLAAASSLLLLGPPRIAVQTTNLGAGEVARVEAHFHTEEREARVYGTAYSWSRGQRLERDVPLERIDAEHYRVRRSWDAGIPVVLVLGVEQGEGGKHGVAEALVRVARDGRVAGVDLAMTRPIIGNPMPRRVNDREIEGALDQLGARTAD
jgi:hypothetical protein